MASRAVPYFPDGSSRCGRVVSSLDLSPESSDWLDLAGARAEERASFVPFSEQEGHLDSTDLMTTYDFAVQRSRHVPRFTGRPAQRTLNLAHGSSSPDWAQPERT